MKPFWKAGPELSSYSWVEDDFLNQGGGVDRDVQEEYDTASMDADTDAQDDR